MEKLLASKNITVKGDFILSWLQSYFKIALDYHTTLFNIHVHPKEFQDGRKNHVEDANKQQTAALRVS